MDLKDSKYLVPKKKSKKKDPNPWKEIQVSESNLVVALEYALRQSTHLARDESIERVIVGEPSNGIHPLSVAIIKRKEV